MDFVSNQKHQIEEMLGEIGIKSVDGLFSCIPEKLRLDAPKDDDGHSEYEGLKWMETLAGRNSFQNRENYLGAGAYEHHVPAIVGAICQKSEFLTAYTPYQPEVSQGMLQIIFEFQSAIAALTGMDVANASVYDGSSACSEALLMALRIKRGRKKVLVADSIHPSAMGVIEQYIGQNEFTVERIACNEDGTLSHDDLKDQLREDVAGVLLGYPNFYGQIEDVRELVQDIQSVGALAIVSANPLVYGLYASAGELGVDIAVGDCQPIGLSLNFGGPYAGYLACKQEYVRQMPGRLVGETLDTEGRRGFVLTLQAREQHIRREKATSNICTNQALSALASLVTLIWYGKEGIHQLALTNFQRASYLRSELLKLPQFSPLSETPFFNEFAVRFDGDLDVWMEKMRESGIEPGFKLQGFDNVLLIAVTETKNQKQLSRYIECAKEVS